MNNRASHSSSPIVDETEVIREIVVVGNEPLGLHLRPASAFAKLAQAFQCRITVSAGTKKADGRSPSELLMLFAAPGTELTLEIHGENAATALEPLKAILTADGEPDLSPPEQ